MLESREGTCAIWPLLLLLQLHLCFHLQNFVAVHLPMTAASKSFELFFQSNSQSCWY